MLVAAGVALLVALIPTVTLAGPPSPPDYGNWNPTGLPLPPILEDWGLEKALPRSAAPGAGEVHIVTDPLVGVGVESDATGWVTFWCQSKIGFQYNIGATGLIRLSKYSVKATNRVQIKIVQPGEGLAPYEIEPDLWVDMATLTPLSDLDLGVFQTDANGNGGVRGVVKLEAGYVYDFTVEVSDGTTKVLEPGLMLLPSPPYPPDTWAPDTNGFIVY